MMRRMKQKIRTIHTLSKLGSKRKPSLPPNWVSSADRHTKRTFYYNTATGESSWIRPKHTESNGYGHAQQHRAGDAPSSRIAVLVVNVQKDFFHKGSLPVTNADKILGPIKALCKSEGASVVHIRLLRPANHASFFSNNPGAVFQEQISGIEQEM